LRKGTYSFVIHICAKWNRATNNARRLIPLQHHHPLSSGLSTTLTSVSTKSGISQRTKLQRKPRKQPQKHSDINMERLHPFAIAASSSTLGVRGIEPTHFDQGLFNENYSRLLAQAQEDEDYMASSEDELVYGIKDALDQGNEEEEEEEETDYNDYNEVKDMLEPGYNEDQDEKILEHAVEHPLATFCDSLEGFAIGAAITDFQHAVSTLNAADACISADIVQTAHSMTDILELLQKPNDFNS
ncbi:hypothetical protein H0H93_012211, partial [Arthromyces matolae]